MPFSREETESLLAAIVATSDDAIVSKDLNGIVQTWNASAQRIFGWSPQEMIGQPITRIIPPERRDEEVSILNKIRRGEHIDHYQTVRVRKDGRRIDVSVTISPLYDSRGTVVGASKIAQDVTVLNRSLRERHRLYELSKAMAGELDIQTLLQRITDAATEVTGAQFGAFFYNVVNAEGGAYMLYTLSGAPREKFERFPMPRNTEVFSPTFSGEAIVRSDDITQDPRYGRNAPFHGMPPEHLPVRSYLAVPVIGRSGKVLGGLFFGHEQPGIFTEHSENVVGAIAGQASVVIENARMHSELQQNLAQLRQLANCMPQLAWMARPDGWVYWYNERWYQYTGMDPASQEGWGWESVHDPQELPRVVTRWRHALDSGEPWEDTFPLRRHDGEFRWHLARAMPVRDGSGKITLWFGTNTDITDQRNLVHEREELLVAERAARREAERVSQMKDEFLATLSHELRTPLSAILGWSVLLKRDQRDPPTLQEGLDVIERNARAQTQLIEDLLDMSRIVSGKIRLDVQRMDTAAVVDAAIESVRPAATAKQIQLRKVLDPRAGPVSGDPNRLQQVVWNLLTNAIKFTPKGGKVEVLLERVNSHVEITVTDTGEGIKPEFLPYVFDRFRQADSSTTREHPGLGLGLSIVRQLVELHGGRVWVKSAGKGQGATFSVALPLAVTRHGDEPREHPTRSFGPPADIQPISLEGITVLIVDDEPDTRNLIRRLLDERGAHVVTAASASEALDVMRHHRPDLILSDIGMPQVDGYAFLRQVRSLPPDQGGKTPAVALTAFARSEDRTRAIMAGYQLHIAKPIEPPELIAMVASAVGRIEDSELASGNP